MTTSPLTLQQASELCRDYQNLVGSSFQRGALGKGNIECIAVAPFEESKQWLFAQYYKECKDPKRSLQFYNGPHYEVVALSVPILRKRGILFRDLRGYLHEHEIPFYKNRYEGLSRNMNRPLQERV